MMNKKTTEPFIPTEIMGKIQKLESPLNNATELYDDIFSWYDKELKSYNPAADASDELFDPGTGYVVPGISYDAIMEGLSTVQTFNETHPDD